MRVELAEKASKKERERVLRTEAEQAAEEDKAKVQRGGGADAAVTFEYTNGDVCKGHKQSAVACDLYVVLGIP